VIQLDPDGLRDVRSIEDLLGYLADELDWPEDIAADPEDAVFDWAPEELGIPAERLPDLTSLRQLRPLTADQPWGIFLVEFSGPRLPLGALRRLLERLVSRKRGTGGGTRRTWDLDDLLFVVSTGAGSTAELHMVAFFQVDGRVPEVRSIAWRPEQSPHQHLRRLARELLPHLAWPDEGVAPDHWRAAWRSAFKLRHGEAIAGAARLAERMAETAFALRQEIGEAIAAEPADGPFTTLMEEVRTQLVGDVDPPRFADMCAQTIVYGVLTSRVTDPAAFGASPTLAAVPLANPFLAAFFDDVVDQAASLDLDDIGLEQLVADLRATNVEAILDQFGATARGGDPVIHFYEEFLKRYDARARADAGAFYTPQPVVEFMVRTVDELMRSRFGLARGIADPATWAEVAESNGFAVPRGVDPSTPFVSMIDPATGTGTFLVEWIRRAHVAFLQGGGAPSGWSEHLRTVVLPSLHGFELMLGPYAIAHLKVALELHEDDVHTEDLSILLTDTLDHAPRAAALFHDDPVSAEGERAAALKAGSGFAVCIGNPPYDRVARSAGGGVITDATGGRSLFDDLLDPAREHTIFSHHASLYNTFVYFWRWALWQVFERRAGCPGVVSFIAPSSWLWGPGFLGLRRLVRELADEVWVVDLAGDNRGTRRDENVFEIETPVAIVTAVRSGGGDRAAAARARYHRLEGTAAEKLAALAGGAADLGAGGWIDLPSAPYDPLLPLTGGTEWRSYPALTDLFPWQQPGCKFGRTWPIAPSRDVLEQRWLRLVATTDPDDRAACFVTPSHGRNVNTRVGDRRTIAEEPVGAPPPPIARYGYRSFDRQWAFDDPRLAALERPSLWASASERQIFMATMPTNALGLGVSASVTADVPDLHFFCGRGGKDILPLHRDAAGTPNVDPSALEAISGRHTGAGATHGVGAPELFSYAYAVLAGTDYSERFRQELETPGPRVPLTADGTLFAEVADLGRDLIWLHTFGARFASGRDAAAIRLDSVAVSQTITILPATARSVFYDADKRALTIGDGRVEGVSPEAWAFEVSGMPILKKWLGYRTMTPPGRAARSESALDAIRPDAWPLEWTDELIEVISVLQRTIDLRPRGIALLDRIVAGPTIPASDLPPVPLELRRPPPVPAGRAAEA